MRVMVEVMRKKPEFNLYTNFQSLAEYLKDKKLVSVHQLEKCVVDWVNSLPESHIDVKYA